ncbi:MAG: sporulation initiation factor Spo0A C-terminal domain-containing protein [Clostridia bacterium]|nr:sporulation initiation factor Spo0A C-terminal domain-containing protein [Clostridia bacterium]
MTNVLIANPNVAICEALAKYLEGCDGVDAVKHAVTQTDFENTLATMAPNILIIDADFPDGDGLEFVAGIRARRSCDGIRVILIADEMTDEMITQTMELGVDYCMLKPVKPTDLYERVQMVSQSPARKLPTPRRSNRRFYIHANSLLNEYAVKANVSGYRYLRMALQISVKHREQSRLMLTKQVYPIIANRYNTDSELVEKAIRCAISTAWDNRHKTRSGMNVFEAKPCNGYFIAILTQRLLSEYEWQIYDLV